jgi:CheY-like chemotaxis protein
VLVVDDDPDILNLVQVRLRSGGHQAIGAGSAEEALELVSKRGHPDIVVLDVSMPGTDGFELLTALRSQPGLERVPAIFLSARVMPEDIEAGRALGATYLTKPFVTTALLDAIDRSLIPTDAGTW